ncbi:MAG: hypothetical protein Q4C54_04485 [Clostridia bacterium]|nr:hypothetical protein [Clostridia bacterium]
MKKLIALFLVLLMIPFSAFADATHIFEEIDVAIVVPDEMVELDISDDPDGTLMLACLSKDETLSMVVHMDTAEGLTLDDMKAELEQTEGITSSGITEINGLPTLFLVGETEEYSFVSYFYVANGWYINFSFCFTTEEAAALSGQIMETLAPAV